MSPRLIVTPLLCLALGACGDPYVRPELSVPDVWGGVPASTAVALTPAKTAWPAFFADSALQSLITAALEHNRDLRIATARIEEARALHGLTRAELLPNVSIGGGLNKALTPGNLGGSNQSVTGQRFDVSLSVVSFELDFWGRIGNLSEAARASYLASAAAQRVLRISLIAEVANTYFGFLEANERLGIARAALALAEESAALIAQAHAAGYAPLSELLQAQSAIETAAATCAGIERERTNAIDLLQFLAGRKPGDVVSDGAAMKLGEAEIAVGLPAEVLLARPDVVAAEQRLIAANANIGAARAAFLPKILLTGLFGTASQSLRGLFAAGTQSWAFQPTLSLPLFDAGRTAANIDLAEARKVVAVAEYERTVQQAFWEVANLLATRTALREQLRSAEGNLRAQEGRLAVAEAMFKGGQVNWLNVLDVRREILAVRLTITQLRRGQATAAAQLYKALGGGQE
ncbi:efflux transporter outer membrane subunit [Rhodocyclaceae bacterium]